MINRFNPGGDGLALRGLLEPTVDELKDAFAACELQAERLGLIITSNVCTPVCVIEPRDFKRVGFAFCSPDLSVRPLTLDPEGNLRFCNHSPVRMGNIFEAPLEEILVGEYARSWAATRPEVCAGCEDWERCMGGCRAACEQLGLGLEHADPLVGRAHDPQ